MTATISASSASDDEDMALAANRLGEIKGGFVVVEDGKVTGEIALPVAGLMSLRRYERVRDDLTTSEGGRQALGSGSRGALPATRLPAAARDPASEDHGYGPGRCRPLRDDRALRFGLRRELVLPALQRPQLPALGQGADAARPGTATSRSRVMAASMATRPACAQGTRPERPDHADRAFLASTCWRAISTARARSPTRSASDCWSAPICSRRAPVRRRRLARLRRAARRDRRRAPRAAGYDFAWHNHDFEFKPLADGSVPQDAHPDGGARHRLGDRRRLGGARRRRSAAMDRRACGKRIVAVHVKDIAPAGESADEDGWSDVGHGTHRLGGPDEGASREDAGARIYVMEQDNPNDIERFARRSIEAVKRSSRGQTMAKSDKLWGRRHRMRQHFDRLFPARAAVSRHRDAAPAPTSTWTPREARRRRSSACAPRRSSDLLEGRRTSTSSSTSPFRPCITRCPGQALDAGKHVYSEKPFVLSRQGRPRPQEARRKEGPARRLGARHVSRRRAPAGAG